MHDHGNDHTHEQAKGEEDERLFDGLRRRFTVKACRDKHVQLLYLNKKDLIHMKTEFPDCF